MLCLLWCSVTSLPHITLLPCLTGHARLYTFSNYKLLKELDDWLTKTEERTKKMEEEPFGPDLEDLKCQVQQHKVCRHYDVLFLEY